MSNKRDGNLSAKVILRQICFTNSQRSKGENLLATNEPLNFAIFTGVMERGSNLISLDALEDSLIGLPFISTLFGDDKDFSQFECSVDFFVLN